MGDKQNRNVWKLTYFWKKKIQMLALSRKKPHRFIYNRCKVERLRHAPRDI